MVDEDLKLEIPCNFAIDLMMYIFKYGDVSCVFDT